MPPAQGADAPALESDLAATEWTLVSFGDAEAQIPILPGSTITLEFLSDVDAGGFGGCNNYTTSYEVEGDAISFGEIISTLVACEDEAITEQEQRYFDALRAATRYAFDADSLTIWYGDQTGVLNFASADLPEPSSQ